MPMRVCVRLTNSGHPPRPGVCKPMFVTTQPKLLAAAARSLAEHDRVTGLQHEYTGGTLRVQIIETRVDV